MKIYFVVCILLVSCNNSQRKTTEVALPAEEVKVTKRILDSILINGVLELINTKEHLNYPDIQLNESFIIIGFLADTNYFLDSIVSISYFHNTFPTHNSKNNYKGILNVADYNIAIFDRGNFGHCYYNVDSLQQIPLDSFKCYPMKNIYTEQYYIRDGKLNYYGPSTIIYQDAAN